MNERIDIDVGYRDPLDRRDDFPADRPSPAEYEDDLVERVAEAIENADVDPWPDKKGAEPVPHYTKLARAAIAAMERDR